MIELFRSEKYSKYQLYLKYKRDYDYNIKSTLKTNYFIDFLRNNNLLKKTKDDSNKKHIPHNYKCNSREIQLKILAGIIDSDGYCMKNCIEIVQKNETLLDDIIFIARSLGFAAYKKPVKKYCIYKNEKRENIYFITCIYGNNLDQIPTLVPRKKCYKRKQIKDPLVNSIEIEKLDIDDYYGFTIDGNHRFVLGDYTVTHNTVLALKIISLVGLKTLIIVHKGFLVDQWIERINQFLPGARVGRIQGQILDIENKDIVIGMLQSLSMKEYPEDQFESFGLTTVDEAHHLGAEVFCRALQKIVTKHTLGLSATMTRKDGLSKIFKMFLGDIIHTEKRKDENSVLVKSIEFNIDDDEFNEIEYDYRGNPKYSTMISKLCNFNLRSELIIYIITKELELNPNQQMMILAHNKCLLTYLYKAIEYRKIASVGYYVGGMKQKDLKLSESKNIIIATYSMASEALDIKSLTTLILATPKTEIEQAVGRILRIKHAHPLIIDIIDQHSLFKKQWAKRRIFYQKNNYKIVFTQDYKSNQWKEITKRSGKKSLNNEIDESDESGISIPMGKCLIKL
jgi:superfamily II DNA or RNA helicase